MSDVKKAVSASWLEQHGSDWKQPSEECKEEGTDKRQDCLKRGAQVRNAIIMTYNYIEIRVSVAVRICYGELIF